MVFWRSEVHMEVRRSREGGGGGHQEVAAEASMEEAAVRLRFKEGLKLELSRILTLKGGSLCPWNFFTY
jgi:hypothetical protein